MDRYRFVDKVRTTYRFIRDDGEWYYDINSDGRIDEYERDRKNELERSYNYPEIEFLEDGRIMMNTERYLDYTGSDGSTSSRYGWPSQGKFLLRQRSIIPGDSWEILEDKFCIPLVTAIHLYYNIQNGFKMSSRSLSCTCSGTERSRENMMHIWRK